MHWEITIDTTRQGIIGEPESALAWKRYIYRTTRDIQLPVLGTLSGRDADITTGYLQVKRFGEIASQGDVTTCNVGFEILDDHIGYLDSAGGDTEFRGLAR